MKGVLFMKKFKQSVSKFLAATMVATSLIPSVSANDNPQQKSPANQAVSSHQEQKKGNQKSWSLRHPLLTLGAEVVFLAGVGYAAYKTFEHIDTATVGTPGKNLTRNDFSKYWKKETIIMSGLIPTFGGFAGRQFTVDVVNKRNIVIRDGVTGITRNAFSDCVNAEMIIIPNSVQHIDNYAFSNLHFGFRPKIRYNGRVYDNASDFLAEFRQINH